MRIKSLVSIFLLISILGGLLWVTRTWQTTIVSSLMAPVVRWYARFIEPAGSAIRSFWTVPVNTDVQQLVAERDRWMKRAIELEAMVSYQRDLQELLDFRRRYAMESAIPVQVLLARISPAGHSLLVDGGKKKGIVKDMVALYNHHLIGRVTEVYETYAEVVLITDAKCSVPAICSPSGARGVLEGLNKLNEANLLYVSHLDKIQVGDLVTSYGETVFPRGFALGRVKSVTPAGVFYQVSVEPLIPVTEVRSCLLVKKGEVENWQQRGQPLPPELAITATTPPAVEQLAGTTATAVTPAAPVDATVPLAPVATVPVAQVKIEQPGKASPAPHAQSVASSMEPLVVPPPEVHQESSQKVVSVESSTKQKSHPSPMVNVLPVPVVQP